MGLLVVDAREGASEAGLCSSGQTREHALLAYCFAFKHMVCLINKVIPTGLEPSPDSVHGHVGQGCCEESTRYLMIERVGLPVLLSRALVVHIHG